MPDNKTPLAKKEPPSQLAVLAKKLNQRMESFTELLAKRMPVGIFVDGLLAVYNKQPDLHACTEDSQIRAWRMAATMGQIPGVDVHFVPFKNKKGFKELVSITDYKDICRKAMDSGFVDDIYGRAVYKDDTFEVIEGTNPQIIHKPNLFSKNRADSDIIAFYMVAKMKGSAVSHSDVMLYSEVKTIQARAAGGEGDAWKFFFPRMGIKTILKRGCKTLPRNIFPIEFLEQLKREEDAAYPGEAVLNADFDVLQPGRHKLGAKKEAPKSEVEQGSESESGTGKTAPAPSTSIADVKHELKTLLAAMPAGESEDACFANGIDNLNECQDVVKLQELLTKLKGE